MRELKIQSVLRETGMSPEQVGEKYGLDIDRSFDGRLVLFNYDDLRCDRFGEVARCCRGTILEDGTWNLVALPFFRFFNFSERPSEAFRWHGSVALEKVDGTLITLFNYEGKWRIATRGKIDATGSLPCPETGVGTFAGAVWPLLRSKLPEPGVIDPACVYVFEFVSPWNRIVRLYDEPALYLLTIRDLFLGVTSEVSHELSDNVARACSWKRPRRYNVDDPDAVSQLIADLPETEEGFVVCDPMFRRFKMKSSRYLQIHKTLNNGKPQYWRMLMENTGEDILRLFPAYEAEYRAFKAGLDAALASADDAYARHKGATSRKEFSTLVHGHPMEGFIWKLYDHRCQSAGEALRQMRPEQQQNFLKEKLPGIMVAIGGKTA